MKLNFLTIISMLLFTFMFTNAAYCDNNKIKTSIEKSQKQEKIVLVKEDFIRGFNMPKCSAYKDDSGILIKITKHIDNCNFYVDHEMWINNLSKCEKMRCIYLAEYIMHRATPRNYCDNIKIFSNKTGQIFAYRGIRKLKGKNVFAITVYHKKEK